MEDLQNFPETVYALYGNLKELFHCSTSLMYSIVFYKIDGMGSFQIAITPKPVYYIDSIL